MTRASQSTGKRARSRVLRLSDWLHDTGVVRLGGYSRLARLLILIAYWLDPEARKEP